MMKKQISSLFYVLMILGSFCKNVVAENYSALSLDELNSAFIEAAKQDDACKIEKLIQAGADVNTLIFYIWTEGDCDWRVETHVLIYAIRTCRFKIIPVLLKEKNKFKEILNEAMVHAIKLNYLRVVKELIKNGININEQIEYGEKGSFLHLAVDYNREEIVKILLQSGAQIDSLKYGETVLMRAVRNHNLYIVQQLLKVPEMLVGPYFGFGTKPINYANKDGNTALILALYGIQTRYYDSYGYRMCVNSQEIVKELLSTSGIDIDHANKEGITARQLCEKYNKQCAYK